MITSYKKPDRSNFHVCFPNKICCCLKSFQCVTAREGASSVRRPSPAHHHPCRPGPGRSRGSGLPVLLHCCDLLQCHHLPRSHWACSLLSSTPSPPDCSRVILSRSTVPLHTHLWAASPCSFSPTLSAPAGCPAPAGLRREEPPSSVSTLKDAAAQGEVVSPKGPDA